MKKISIVLVITILIGCLSGCGGGSSTQLENPGYPTTVPTYAEDKELEIMAFWSPPINEQQYTWLKECGITAVLVDNKYESYTGANRKRILTMCQELGIDVYFPLDRNVSADAVEQFAPWVDYPAFKGLYCDEPITKRHIDNIAAQYEALMALNPELVYIGNLLGDYSEDPNDYSWIYSTNEEFLAEVADGQFFVNYDAYVQYYKDTVIKDRTNIRISATNYPLLAYDMGYESTLDTKWLQTLGTCKQTADNAGAQMWQFIATTAYHNGGNVNYHRHPTESDIRWQAYAALACGATGIEEFVYTTVGAGAEFTAEDHGPIWWEDQNDFSTYYRTDVYYSAQAVHQELQKFDHVLMAYDWQGLLCYPVIAGSPSARSLNNAVGVLDGHDRIKNVESSRDLLIGCFKDENGYDGFMIVNFDETAMYNQIPNEVTVKFAFANQAVAYIKGEQQIVDLDKDLYTFSLMPGEAIFVIPIA